MFISVVSTKNHGSFVRERGCKYKTWQCPPHGTSDPWDIRPVGLLPMGPPTRGTSAPWQRLYLELPHGPKLVKPVLATGTMFFDIRSPHFRKCVLSFS